MEEWGHNRMGFIHTLYKRNGEWIREISDNDGGHTAPYLAGMSFKYAVTGEEKARQEAIESFKNAISLLPNPWVFIMDDGLYRYYLALTYYESGDLQMARDEFEGIIEFIPGRIGFGDLYAESYYKLGVIYEQQGNTAKAIEHYEKFLDLWKDADPGIAAVDDARKRLAGLE